MSDDIQWQRAEEGVCRRCGSKNAIMVEYSWESPEHYDGISEYKCLDCDTRIGRWTGQELKLGYIEPRLGEGGRPVPIKDDMEDD